MKRALKTGFVIWLLTLALCAGALAAGADDPVAFVFNGREVHRSELQMNAEGYAAAQLISSPAAIEEAIAYMIENRLAPEAKAAELGLDQYTEAELADIRAEADQYYEAQLDAYVESLMPNAPEEDKADFRQSLREYWEEMGTTLEVAEETHLFNHTRDRLLEVMDVEISDEEIERVFAEQVEKDRAYFEGNYRAYEYYTHYRNSDIWYVPEGIRGVLQIMLSADETLTKAYQSAVEAGEDASAEREAVLDSVRDKLDEIRARLDAGEAFTDLIDAYNEDPGMSGDTLETGYSVHPESTVWLQEFTDAAFSDAMAAPGDVSEPVVSAYGVHILYYLRDVPAGAVALDDRIRASISDHIGALKRGEMLKQWAAEYEVEYRQDVIEQMRADAEAAMAADEAAQ